MERKARLLVTGGCGVIGEILRKALNEKYEVTSLDLSPCNGGDACITGDITKFEQIEPCFRGVDLVLHLAADSSLEASWDSVYSRNILGTYNVFEASRINGVRRIVFASSNHVTGLYEKDWPISSIVKGDYEDLDPQAVPKISHTSPPRADSYYGASKLFGEGLGQYYSDLCGICVVCLRIGTVRPYEWPKKDEVRFFATWLSHRDLVQLVEKSLAADSIKFDIFYGVSNNKWRFWDISHAKDIIGYDPDDNAEDHR